LEFIFAFILCLLQGVEYLLRESKGWDRGNLASRAPLSMETAIHDIQVASIIYIEYKIIGTPMILFS